MTVRYYIMPLQVVGNRRGPKYLRWRDNPAGLDVPWSLKDFGFEPACMVAADVDPAQHQAISANPDVLSAPENLDDVIDTAQKRDAARAALDTLNVPSGFVQMGMTFRAVVRPLCHLFLFAQRYHAMTGRKLVEAGYTLRTQIGDLPQSVRQDLTAVADSLGYDHSGVHGAMTYQQGLKLLADQWGDRPVRFGNLGDL